MRKIIPGILFILLSQTCLLAQESPKVIPLWENGAPGFESRKDIPETAKDYWVRNINNPSITVFLPPKEKANGCAVIVAPGGGFHELVFDAEGKQAAEFFNSIGVAAFVLKYRLPQEEGSPYTPENVRQDASRAIRMVRSHADEFNVDPKRIGILGFSAGGAVVMMVAFDKGDGDPKAADPIDRVNGRPDFEMMVYPGGKVPENITADAPPAFLICANDDEYNCDEVTMELLQKFRQLNVPAEAIFLSKGKHAFNMGKRSTLKTVNTWPDRMADWMGDSGFLNRNDSGK
jgi:acetyl esterase/lipase